MPQYNNYGHPQSLSYENDRTLINKSFMWMFFGLLLSAVTSYLFYSTGAMLYIMLRMPALSLILAIVQIGIAIAFTSMMQRATPTTLKVLFLAYAFTLGISLSSLCYAYTGITLFAAFLVSAVYFGCLAIVGFTTKMDLSKFGNLCLVGLIAMIICQLVMMLFGIPQNVRLISIIGLLIFTGLTAWDMQKLKKMNAMSFDGQMTERLSIYFALELYLDFINIFLYVLRLLGNNNRN